MSLVIDSGFTQWDPSLITTALWLDAADSATLFTDAGVTPASVGSNVQQWNDKSGNARHATQLTLANQPLYNTNRLTFDTNDLMSVGSALGTSNQNGFVLAAVASSTSTDSGLIGQDNADVSFWRVRGLNQLRDVGGTAAPYSNTFNINDTAIHIVSWIQAGTTIKSQTDGSAVTTLTTSGQSSFQYLTSSVKIGRRSSEATNYGNKEIRELIIVSALCNFSVIEKLEGYLAHKWGLTANLPSDHPYKVNPPAP